MHLSNTVVVILTLVGYFVFSAAVGAMLPPTAEQHARFYGWLYRFLQRLAANADRLAEARFGKALVPPLLPAALEQALADPTGNELPHGTVAATVTASATESIHYEQQP